MEYKKLQLKKEIKEDFLFCFIVDVFYEIITSLVVYIRVSFSNFPIYEQKKTNPNYTRSINFKKNNKKFIRTILFIGG